MTTLDRTLAALIAVGMIGVVVLLALDKSVNEFVPLVTALIGLAAGKQISSGK